MTEFAALVLAGGRGSRMGLDTPKQFLEYRGKPLFLWSALEFLRAGMPVTLVFSPEDLERAKEEAARFGEEIAETGQRLDFTAGGKERFESSFLGLQHLKKQGGCRYVLIHDAARPFVTAEVIGRAKDCVKEFGTAVAAVPSVDTVKIADEAGIVRETPDRSRVFIIQTPQAFGFSELFSAYEAMFSAPERTFTVTDDSSVMERVKNAEIRLFRGDYANIKITTPEDLKYLQ